MKTVKELEAIEAELIREALQVQNACNLSGVVYSFANAMQALCDLAHEQGKGTDWKNTHRVSRLYADKIKDLTGELRFKNGASDYNEQDLSNF